MRLSIGGSLSESGGSFRWSVLRQQVLLVIAIMVMIVAEVTEGPLVAVAEAFPVFISHFPGDSWMPEFWPLFNGRFPVSFKVAVPGLNAVLEAPALCIAEFIGRNIPIVIVVPVLQERQLRVSWGCRFLSDDLGGRSQCKSNSRPQKTVESHGNPPCTCAPLLR